MSNKLEKIEGEPLWPWKCPWSSRSWKWGEGHEYNWRWCLCGEWIILLERMRVVVVAMAEMAISELLHQSIYRSPCSLIDVVVISEPMRSNDDYNLGRRLPAAGAMKVFENISGPISKHIVNTNNVESMHECCPRAVMDLIESISINFDNPGKWIQKSINTNLFFFV